MKPEEERAIGREGQRKRLEQMEHAVAHDPARLQARADEQRREREVRTWTRVLSAFPLDLHERVMALLTEHRFQLYRAHPALARLHTLVWHGDWEPVPLPRAVAEVYLEDPKALAWSKCAACGLPLPRRPGFWVEVATGRWWQAPLRYFDECPGCGGEVVNWSPHDRTQRCHWLPPVPDERYRFQDESPNGPPNFH